MISRRTALGVLATSALGSASVAPAIAQARQKQIAVVVKIGGIPWFNAMEVGIKRAAQQAGVNAWMIGPTQADAAQQVRAVEDLIARKVDVIAVVPNDATALQPVFGRAQAAGIKVITHESPDQQGNDWDIELTTVEEYGRQHMDLLAKDMGGTGKYIVIVGSLTVPLHNKWADASIAWQKEKYPGMELAADRFGVGESVDASFTTVLDQMRARPDLKGILAYGSQGPIGAARALDERNRAKQVVLVGSFSPGQGARYVRNGTIRGGYIWSPLLAGETIVRVGAMLADGKQPTNGMVLPELGAVKVYPEQRLIQAQKLEALDKDNIGKLVEVGL